MYGFISGLSKRCNEMDWGVTVTVPDLPIPLFVPYLSVPEVPMSSQDFRYGCTS